MIPHLAWSVISTVKTNFIIWKILKIVLLPRNPWQHIAYLKLNQPKIKATKFPQKIVCGNATDTALYISANGNAAETLRKRETRPHFALTCFRPPEMWRKLEPSDFRKISEIRKRLISPCDSYLSRASWRQPTDKGSEYSANNWSKTDRTQSKHNL